MRVKWRLVAQLQYYRFLFLLGLKSEEIYYIGGSEALPPPLTREEEEYLLQRLSTGDAAIRAMQIKYPARFGRPEPSEKGSHIGVGGSPE